jgi:DNA-binding FadR family transcriptional regulator
VLGRGPIPIARSHVAADVFEQLARAILSGEELPGDALAPERVLAEQFQVSRLTVRQALHRLAEVGLVRVKQGGATVVLDPAETADLRVLDLRYRLGPVGADDQRRLMERQLLTGHGILSLAARRASDEERAQLTALYTTYLASARDDADYLALERGFWRTLAAATHNPFYSFEVHWWYSLLAEERRLTNPAFGPTPPQALFLGELIRRLAARLEVERFYLDAALALIDAGGAPLGDERTT